MVTPIGGAAVLCVLLAGLVALHARLLPLTPLSSISTRGITAWRLPLSSPRRKGCGGGKSESRWCGCTGYWY